MLKNSQMKMVLMPALICLLSACSVKAVPATATTIPTPNPNYFPAGAYVSGEWTLEFKADGTFSLTGPSEGEIGAYTSAKDRVTITTPSCGNVKGT